MRTLAESNCNRSAGGRRHDRKCPVRKSDRAVGTNGGRRQSAHRHSAGRAGKPWNYRAGQGRWREPHSGIRKSHRAVGTRGRGC